MSIMDIRDMRRCLSSTSPLSLRYMASLYDDTNPWKESDEDDAKGLVFTNVMADLKRYNAQDCTETSRCHEGMVLEPEWNTPRVQKLYEVHSALARIAASMYRTGMLVNRSERRRLTKDLLRSYEEKEAALLAKVAIPKFSCSPNGMRSLVWKRHATVKVSRFNLPDPMDPSMWSTEDKTIKVDTDALLNVIIDPLCPPELTEIVELYWAAESVWKQRSTFVTSKKVEQAIGRDNRLRPGWNSCGTDTGRFSCSEPNVMNIEKDLRAMYRAAPGKRLVHADYSQLELRVMAAVSGDTVLANALATGDVYSVDAKAWFGLPADMDVKKLKPEARSAAKTIHLASQYAAGTDTVHRKMVQQNRKSRYSGSLLLHSAFKRTYEQTVAYWHAEQDRVRATGYSESRILFRRRRYPREPPITEVANYPVQSTASDVANLAMVEIDRQLKKVRGANLIVQLHDAFDVECWARDVPTVQAIMRDAMEVQHTINGQKFTFPVDFKVAISWADVA